MKNWVGPSESRFSALHHGQLVCSLRPLTTLKFWAAEFHVYCCGFAFDFQGHFFSATLCDVPGVNLIPDGFFFSSLFSFFFNKKTKGEKKYFPTASADSILERDFREAEEQCQLDSPFSGTLATFPPEAWQSRSQSFL